MLSSIRAAFSARYRAIRISVSGISISLMRLKAGILSRSWSQDEKGTIRTYWYPRLLRGNHCMSEGLQNLLSVYWTWTRKKNNIITIVLHKKISLNSLAIRRRTATSFSTPKSSNVCGVNANLRRVLLHRGQGAGPNVNNRSIHDSHLQPRRKQRDDFWPTNNEWSRLLTFYDSMNLLTNVI